MIIKDLDLTHELTNSTPIDIWNDNNACVCWSKNTTTKGLRHVQIRENAVREGVSNRVFKIKHIAGKKNPSDIFSKEDKDTEHYLLMRDSLLVDDANEINQVIQQSDPTTEAPITGGCHVGSIAHPTRSTH